VEFEPPPEAALPERALKGRGAVSNRPGRYEPGERPLEDDGWSRDEGDEFATGKPATVIGLDSSRSIIARNDSPDIPFDRSINPYRGCEHGCVYCYARPTHAYLGHSPGLDFETKLYAKPDAARLLRQEISRPGYKPAMIALGSNTDPYQPIERSWRLTRQILAVLSEFNHPVGITTKSARIVDDIDLIADMARRRLAMVAMSVTTLDRDLARVMEPRASTPANRLAAIRALSRAGIPVAVSVAPIIPALNDHEIERIIEEAAKAGASAVNWVVLRLPLEIKDLFAEWLEEHRPERARHVLSLVGDLHGGRLYRSEFGARMEGSGPYSELIRQRVLKAAKRHGLEKRRWHELDASKFRVPPSPSAQMRLFD
jgi:DNA repair photolyase